MDFRITPRERNFGFTSQVKKQNATKGYYSTVRNAQYGTPFATTRSFGINGAMLQHEF
jgi:hypothetical protein